MYIGEYSHNLDSKGRLIIPSKFRECMEKQFYIVRDIDQCICIYSCEQMDAKLKQLETLPQTKKAVRVYTRMLTSTMTLCSFDSQGRILIPTTLQERVGITKECTVIGANDHVEIWDKDTWNSYYDETVKDYSDIAEEITELLI